MLGKLPVPGRPTTLDFSRAVISLFSLSFGNSIIETEVLSESVVMPKTTNLKTPPLPPPPSSACSNLVYIYCDDIFIAKLWDRLRNFIF